MTWPTAMKMAPKEVLRADIERDLFKSVENEKRLRRRLGELESDAVALRETRSPLLESHATEMAAVRGELTLACRRSTRIREYLRAGDLL
jgi:hypothetical protein